MVSSGREPFGGSIFFSRKALRLFWDFGVSPMSVRLFMLLLRARVSRLLRAIHQPLAPRVARAPLLDALWLTYARLAEANPDCHEASDFLSAAAARVQADALRAAQARDPVSTADLIEVIVRAVGSLHLQRAEELQVIRARLTAAVVQYSAPLARSRQPLA
jgi:hypothetical protein